MAHRDGLSKQPRRAGRQPSSRRRTDRRRCVYQCAAASRACTSSWKIPGCWCKCAHIFHSAPSTRPHLVGFRIQGESESFPGHEKHSGRQTTLYSNKTVIRVFPTLFAMRCRCTLSNPANRVSNRRWLFRAALSSQRGFVTMQWKKCRGLSDMQRFPTMTKTPPTSQVQTRPPSHSSFYSNLLICLLPPTNCYVKWSFFLPPASCRPPAGFVQTFNENSLRPLDIC